jgi:uncharacterized damage-inducible protein DinB
MADRSTIERLCRHMTWADNEILRALRTASSVPDAAVREFAHVVGAEEVWLSRLERRASDLAVWPTVYLDDLARHIVKVHEGYERFVAQLSDAGFAGTIAYKNSAGQSFDNRVSDILTHVALHGQYHRGKINLLLRQAGLTPAPTDYIAVVRGAPAATQRS